MPPTKYIATMKTKTSQNGVRNFPSPWIVTPTKTAVARAPSDTRRATTFAPTSMPSVQPVKTMPSPRFSTPSTSST